MKALDPAPAASLERLLALGAEDHGEVLQRDTYFHAVQGRLKLREAPPAAAELISYRRADRSGPAVSHYRRVQVSDHLSLAEALADSLGVQAIVEKVRRLLVWRDVRIHLDRVAGLGEFIEFEAPAATAGLEGEQQKLDELRAALGVGDDAIVAAGYAQLVQRMTPRLGRL